MARNDLTKLTAEGPYGDYGAGDADLPMVAADQGDGDQFTFEGEDLIIAHNTGGSAQTVTVTSVVDPYGRTGNISYSVGAGEYAVFGPFKALGWQQSDGNIYVSADSADVKLGVVKLPG